MEEQEILDEMINQNPWWSSGKLEPEPGIIERPVLGNIKKELDTREVIALIGLRSVGKTTILKQLIRELLLKGQKPKTILYFSFDGFRKEARAAELILGNYSRYILKTPLSSLNEKIYIFFDEVQKAEDWGETIKTHFDRRENIKFMVSGSSSMNILKGSGESLATRILIHKIYPFTFLEFLLYNDTKIETTEVWSLDYPTDSEKLRILFDEYLKQGGFPALYSTEESRKKPLLRSMVDLVFYRDIVNLFEVKRPDVLEGLFFLFTKESGGIMNYSSLSSSLRTKFETIKTYSEYLNLAFLISGSSFYSGSKIKALEKNEKIYVADHSFSMLEDMKIGNIVETVIFNNLKSAGLDQVYWQNKEKNEIDIIIKSKSLLPIEVKYQENITSEDLELIYQFLKDNKLKRGILVTKNLLTTKTTGTQHVYCIPAWLFLIRRLSVL